MKSLIKIALVLVVVLTPGTYRLMRSYQPREAPKVSGPGRWLR